MKTMAVFSIGYQNFAIPADKAGVAIEFLLSMREVESKGYPTRYTFKSEEECEPAFSGFNIVKVEEKEPPPPPPPPPEPPKPLAIAHQKKITSDEDIHF